MFGAAGVDFSYWPGNNFERAAGSQAHGLAPDRIASRRAVPAEEYARRFSSDAPQRAHSLAGSAASRHSNSPSAFPGPPGGHSPITRSSVPQEACYSPADAFDPVCCTPGRPRRHRSPTRLLPAVCAVPPNLSRAAESAPAGRMTNRPVLSRWVNGRRFIYG